jgi:hypothetical protein
MTSFFSGENVGKMIVSSGRSGQDGKKLAGKAGKNCAALRRQ